MAKTNLEHEFDILNKFNQLRKNLSSYKKDFFQSLISLGPVSCSEERVNKNFVKFFEVLNSIKSLNPSEKDILKTYLQKILQELDTPEQQRIFLDQLHPKIKRFGLSELSSIGIDPEQMLSSEIHYEVTNQAFELEPTRIIAFNKLDASNQEVLTSLKIAYAKHKDEHVLITCSAKDLQTFGAKCETLVLIGHGSFY
jgi:hypothetical protein